MHEVPVVYFFLFEPACTCDKSGDVIQHMAVSGVRLEQVMRYLIRHFPMTAPSLTFRRHGAGTQHTIL